MLGVKVSALCTIHEASVQRACTLSNPYMYNHTELHKSQLLKY